MASQAKLSKSKHRSALRMPERTNGSKLKTQGRSVHSIQTREVDYAHQIQTPPSRFSDLPTTQAYKNISFIQKLTKGQRGGYKFLENMRRLEKDQNAGEKTGLCFHFV